MTDVAADLAVAVRGAPSGDGLILSVTNNSAEERRIRFPNPYTGIGLATESGERVVIGRTILCYDEDDPAVTLRPGESATAQTTFAPFWFDLHGTFMASCTLGVSEPGGGTRELVVTGPVQLALKPRSRPSRTDPALNHQPTLPRLGNVSDYVRILG